MARLGFSLLPVFIILISLFRSIAAMVTDNVLNKVMCGFPLDEGSIKPGDGYASNMEILLGCVMQWAVFVGFYKVKYGEWPSFIFGKEKKKRTKRNLRAKSAQDEAEMGESSTNGGETGLNS
ncbi:hypothetical protein Ddc_17718 [Ditylenchus destructor]|nr:hypothetical protein Ddc_17718 [Ditylenchus destructor]